MEATKPNPYESIRLDNQLCFPLYACAKEIVRQYRTPLEPLGLTYTQYVVMMVLWECGSITEKELGERIHLDSGTLAPLLKRLDKQGLVKRERPDRNERLLQITLTDAGIALQEEALSVPEAMKKCIGLSVEECSVLRGLLDKSLIAMETRGNKTNTEKGE